MKLEEFKGLNLKRNTVVELRVTKDDSHVEWIYGRFSEIIEVPKGVDSSELDFDYYKNLHPKGLPLIEIHTRLDRNQCGTSEHAQYFTPEEIDVVNPYFNRLEWESNQ